MVAARNERVQSEAAVARAAAAELREATTRALSVRTHLGAGRPVAKPRPMGTTEAQSDWVPVIDVFTNARLSDSEEALMRRVINSRVAPAPSISYTGRPL